MKHFVILIASLFLVISNKAQTFTWMKGNSIGAQPGIYGTQGVSSPSNNPGCRHGAATWTDLNGDLWLFGGEGFGTTASLGWLNDLWKYSVQTNEWTWIGGSNTINQSGVYGTQGVATVSNQPGAREFIISWTDDLGNFWLFGGDGFDANSSFGKLGDLWKYNPLTNLWTWMKGFNTADQNGVYGTQGVSNISNLPGGRNASGSWIDSNGNLWLFGGRGLPAAGPSGFLNDLWKYNLSTNQWTWMKGSNLISQNGIYGTLNVSSVANLPGGNEFPTCFIQSGELYLFGGRAYPAAGPPSYLNSFWKYTIATNQWTWIGGNNNTHSTGIYGTLKIPAAPNFPGARMCAVGWNDGSGNFWLFGGEGVASSPGVGSLNDLFKYNLSSGLWTWTKGANTLDQLANYGIQTIPSPTTIPGARYYNTSWPIVNGKGWLIGGLGYASINLADNLEDLWQFFPSCQPQSITASPSSSLCSGNSVTLTSGYSNGAAVNWYNIAVGGTAVGTGTTLTIPTLTTAGSNSTYSFYAESNSCNNFPRTAIQLTVLPLPSLSISGTSSICSGDTYSFTAVGSGMSYTWNTGATSANISGIGVNNTTFTVICSDGFCYNQQSISLIVNPLPQVNITGPASLCSGQTTTLSVAGTAVTYTWSTGANTSSILISPSSNSVYTLIGEDANFCSNASTLSLTVHPLPLISVQSKSAICVGEQVLISASGAISYSWSSGQNTNTVSVGPQITSSYTVIGTDLNACSSSQSITVLVFECVGLNESSLEQNDFNFSLFPNPTIEKVSVKKGNLKSLVLVITSVNGMEVFNQQITENELKINLAKGIYFCTGSANSQKLKTIKLVVE